MRTCSEHHKAGGGVETCKLKYILIQINKTQPTQNAYMTQQHEANNGVT